jgi:hypothetical protein
VGKGRGEGEGKEEENKKEFRNFEIGFLGGEGGIGREGKRDVGLRFIAYYLVRVRTRREK